MPVSKASRSGGQPVLSRCKIWTFRFVAVIVLPVFLLVLFELGLRFSGYGYETDAILTVHKAGQTFCYNNPKFTWRFFSPQLARESEPYMFPAVKADNTCRIFVLGASAALGVPEPAFSFSRFLDVLLHDAYPGVTFEVINTGITAINSHAVLEIAKDCAAYQPDVFLVYLGNNEVTGPYGAGSVLTPFSGSLPMIRASVAVKSTRLGQCVTQLLGSLGQKNAKPKIWRGLEMFKDNQVRAGSQSLQAVYRHYQKNLKDIIFVGQKNGANVVLCTVGSNLAGNAPFGSLHRADIQKADINAWEAYYSQGVDYEENQQYGEAVTCYLKAVALDDAYADLHFRLGRCYWAMAQYDAASGAYLNARDMDTLRFRADAKINDIIRKTAAETQVILADTVAAFEENSDYGVPGDTLFYEHVHMNVKGNYLTAKTIIGQIDKALPESVMKYRLPETALLTQEACLRQLAYTAWDHHRIADVVLNDYLKKPPFNSRLYAQAQIQTLEQDLALLSHNMTTSVITDSLAQHAWAVERRQNDWVLHWKYGRLLTEAVKDYSAAVQQFRLMQPLLPMSWLSYSSLASVTKALGDTDGAIAFYERTIELNPICGRAHFNLGEIYAQKGLRDKAMTHYEQAITWEPGCVPAYNELLKIYMSQHKMDKAIEIGRKGLDFTPDSPVLLCSLGTLLARTGHVEEAILQFQAGLKIDPNNAAIRQSLKIIEQETGF